uniref:NADH dehydrogenase subunit 1 n=1 Tax=Enchytraeus irregularis TaxID=2867162 RepID=UPI0022FD5F4F|nr:NADH dehydrogenase subunit 1 [Enchytraeus irregularis]WAS35300.1 NADH dehydrogenase subunit 1 [Enchytraeus irregularis]
MYLSFSLSMIISYLMAMLAMAFYTLMERKLLGYMQLRKGPNKVSLMGVPQPFADAIKLFIKEQSFPSLSNMILFTLAPITSLVLALMLWAIYPHSNTAMYLSFGILYFLCVSSMNVYATFLAGWCSNSKYALLGALRGVAQTISYEVSMSLILICALIIHKKMDISLMSTNMMSWPSLMIMVMFVFWFITNLAETNRTPFDFAEGESELVSGFNVEYSGGMFALIFMAEYANILMMSLLTSVFFTGWIPILENSTMIMKTMVFATLFIWIRATMPRMRYDNLMYLTWKSFLPISLALLIMLIPMM